MSYRDKYGNAAPYIIAVIGVLLFGFLSWQHFYSKGYQRANQEHESERANYAATEELHKRCIQLSTAEQIVECLSSNEQASREHYRSEQDLNAQREMADWAESMLWASVAGVIVTGVGVVYVALTLKETREIAERQLRAYLTVKNVTVEHIRLKETGEVVAVKLIVDVQNGGATPAINISINATIYENDYEPGLPSIRMDGGAPQHLVWARSRVHINGDIGPSVVEPVVETGIPLSGFLSHTRGYGLNATLRLIIEYDAVVSNRRNHLLAQFWIHANSDNSITISRIGRNEIS